MNDKDIFDMVDKYLKMPKTFMPVPDRVREVKKAYDIALELFPEAKVELESDPLQTGALVLSITGYDMTLNDKREIDLFYDMVRNANNFEIAPEPFEEEKIKFGAIFYGAYAMIK